MVSTFRRKIFSFSELFASWKSAFRGHLFYTLRAKNNDYVLPDIRWYFRAKDIDYVCSANVAEPEQITYHCRKFNKCILYL